MAVVGWSVIWQKRSVKLGNVMLRRCDRFSQHKVRLFISEYSAHLYIILFRGSNSQNRITLANVHLKTVK